MLHSCKKGSLVFKNNEFECYEFSDEESKRLEIAPGTLYLGGGEYEVQVNFCPFCGYRARVRSTDEDSL